MAFDRTDSAKITFCEASSASAFERRCVMHSIFNRVRVNPHRYGKTVAAVCAKRFQYSEMNDDIADNNNLERAAVADDNDPIILDCLAAFDEVRTAIIDPTKNATGYHDKSIPPPYWTVGATMTLETPKFFFYSNVK